MSKDKLSFSYLLADGPEGLRSVLDEQLKKSEQNPAAIMGAFYVMYRLGDQKSLIKVDMSEQPFQFWYYDLLGRPATYRVKEAIAKFLWEKCGERDRYV